MKKRLLPNSLTSACLIALCAVLAFAMPSATAQDWAKQMLEKSPRHQEWVKVTYGSRTVEAFVVYPEVSHNATVVLLIHEIFGLSDWARSMADDLAAAGYIVIAPDLLSGFGPNGGGSSAFPDTQATTKAVSGLAAETVTADLNAVADYAKKLPAANGKLAVVGFCWGGGKSFQFATERKDLSAAFVFYGPPPATDAWLASRRRCTASTAETTRALPQRFRPRKTRCKLPARNTIRSSTTAPGMDSCAPAKTRATRIRPM